MGRWGVKRTYKVYGGAAGLLCCYAFGITFSICICVMLSTFFLFFILNAFLSLSQGKEFMSRGREISKRICDGGKRGGIGGR